MPKRRFTAEQPSLLPEIVSAWETNGIFSEHFIRSRLKEFSAIWPKDENTKENVFSSELTEQYRVAICLLEAKKVNHPLDTVSKRETPGRFPHQQVRDYLSDATDQSGNPFFKWAILTNGGIWRLYNRDSRPSAYFQFKLAGQSYFCIY